VLNKTQAGLCLKSDLTKSTFCSCTPKKKSGDPFKNDAGWLKREVGNVSPKGQCRETHVVQGLLQKALGAGKTTLVTERDVR
jgi:hypothetical protein